MPNMNPEQYNRAFKMRTDDRFLGLLDEIRSRERPVLNRAECLRKLVEEAAARLGIKKPAEVKPVKRRKEPSA
jgi:hypothetical protein